MEAQPDPVEATPAEFTAPAQEDRPEPLDLPTQVDPDPMSMITASDDSLSDIVSLDSELRERD